MDDLHRTDFFGWTRDQAEALRGRRSNSLDYDKLAEEIEDLGRAERRELFERMETVMLHLLKLAVSPAQEPRRGWEATVANAQRQIRRLLKDNPSLAPELPTIFAEALADAREAARVALYERQEMPLQPIESVDITADDVQMPRLPLG